MGHFDLPLDRFNDVAYRAILHANMFARLEVLVQYDDTFALEAMRPLEAQEFSKLKFEEAIKFLESKDIITYDNFIKLSDVAKRKAFTVGKDLSEYTTQQVKGYIDKALTEGWSRQKVLANINEHFNSSGLTRLKKHHLETVYDNEVLGSYAHGRYTQLTDPVIKQARPFWKYHTIGDHRVRPTHKAMNGQIYPVDSDVWNTWFPPNGHRCRCSIIGLTSDEASELGIAPTLPTVDPDRGWATNPADYMDKK